MRVFSLLFTLSICMIMGSCCHKIACAGVIDAVGLYDFTEQDLSEIYLIRNDGKDTSRISADLSADSTHYKVYALQSAIELEEDVTLYLPLVNKTYTFSNIRYEKKECKGARCLWSKSYYQEFTGCTINGEQYGKDINLHKE